MSAGVQETLRIATPEGVSLELPLAGVGSRFVALLVDTLLQSLAFTALVIVLLIAGAGGFTGNAVLAVAFFALSFVYPVAFELGAGGRTPGKRWSSLRVICADGSPVTFRASALRNLVRLVDAIPGTYLVGAIAVFASPSNQRLGDLAAGTIVVREPRTGRHAPSHQASAEAPRIEDLPAWDVSGLEDGEIAALRRFLERRHDLDPVPRALLARDLGDRLRPRVGGVGADLEPERFLELIAALRGLRA
jgi:uncharacterized RDD family membrane protein YckC